MADGAFDLARVLFGGGNTTEAYQRGATRAAQLEGLIATAKIKQAEAQAQARLPGALTALDLPADLATVLQGGYNPEQLSGYQGDVQEQGFRGDAVARALAGDWTGANANLMGVASGPQALASVDGQNLIQNRFLPGGGGISTTEQGQADIRQSDASAAASHASATAALGRLGIAQQQFDLQRAGKWNPDGQSGGSGGGAYTAPPIGSLAAALGGEEGRPDQEAVQDFLAWREANPTVRNGNEALTRYLAEITGRAGVQMIDQAQPFTASQIAASIPAGGGADPAMPAPATAPAAPALPPIPGFAASQAEREQLIAAAQRAIAAGADPAEVAKRLAQRGLRLPGN